MLRPAQLLRSEIISRCITANPVTLTILLCMAWILLGLIGHDPWKPDEAHTFGVVYQLLKNGDWIVPRLAGEPYLDKPPLIYLTAALTGTLFSAILPLHDGARVAAGVYMALTFLFVAMTAKELYGSTKSWVAALMLLGCAGLLLRGHQLIADTALLAGLAIGLYALALSSRRPVIAGLLLGTGLGNGYRPMHPRCRAIPGMSRRAPCSTYRAPDRFTTAIPRGPIPAFAISWHRITWPATVCFATFFASTVSAPC